MSIVYQERLAETPFAQTVARIYAEQEGCSLIPADGHGYLYTTTLNGKTSISVGGPITKAISLPHSAGAESIGIRLGMGTFIPQLPIDRLVNGVITLPEAGSKSFWLNGSAWQFPDHDNADTFIDRLERDGALVRDPVIQSALHGEASDLSLRTVQRHFLRATGISHIALRQIQRAQRAALLLQQGMTILDTVFEAGYFDQPHLTRSLSLLVGQTPAQIMRRVEHT